MSLLRTYVHAALSASGSRPSLQLGQGRLDDDDDDDDETFWKVLQHIGESPTTHHWTKKVPVARFAAEHLCMGGTS